MKFSALLILVGLLTSSAYACGGNKDKDDEKDGLRPLESMTQTDS